MHQARYLWFLTLSYCIVILLANWFAARIVDIGGLTTDAGTLIFPLTFLLSDLITEVYGYKFARRAIWCGLLFNAVFIIYGQIVIHLPSPNYPTHNALFDQILAMNFRIIVASTISYLISEPLNSLIMAKLKIRMLGKKMSLRFILSTFAASGIDSVIFCTIAFYGIVSNSNLVGLILCTWLIKVAIEILGLPVSTGLARKLKTKEELDIYDTRTQFNLFSLDTNYNKIDNHYN